MIRVENLKKTYFAIKDKPCTALAGVSFTLPEKGMIFVVGKSGSGKSTLLNLLGGLDSVTEGDIIVGGKRFSEFTEAEYDNYRNNFVGFVFQDFCLIDAMTVFENAKLSSDLRGNSSDDDVSEALRVVDLADFGGRYPRELSGGQKQRVALARALVKKPKLILADEPTGNLDQRTAKQVLDYLKELSRDRLVIIISHNADDAEKYADRIIELADGRVVSDVSRNDNANALLIEGNKINLPAKRRLTESELAEINAAIKNEDAEISQIADEFTPTEQPLEENESPLIPMENKISFKNQSRLARVLSKGNRIHAAVTTVIVSVLLILLSLCQVFSSFNGKALIRESVSADTSYSFALYKGYRLTSSELASIQTDKLVEINEADIQSFYDNGYEGNIYKLYNVSLALIYHGWNTLEEGEHISYSDSKSPYINLCRGVLECDKSFLDGIYGGENESITVLAGDINEATPRAVIITDYFADCIMKYIPSFKSYQDIVDAVVIGQTKFDVKAIIKTGYAERYSALIKECERVLALKGEAREAELEILRKNDDYIAFFDELNDYLSIGYYFGTDFKEQEIAYVQSRGGTSFDNVYLTLGGEKFEGKQWTYAPAEELASGEIRISASLYNEISGTRYKAEELQAFFKPFTLTIADYPYHTSEGQPVYEKTFTVTGISYGPVLFSYKDYMDLYNVHLYPYALYFDNSISAATVYMNTEDGNFFLGEEYYKTIYKIMDIVAVFKDFFLFLYLGLILVCAIILIGFARRSIKRRMYEIGILRALGCTNKTIAGVFMQNMAVVASCVAFISIFGVQILDPLLNKTLMDNLARMLDVTMIQDLRILRFNLFSAILNMLTIIFVSFLSSVGVFLSCRKIKPINIIRSQE